MSLDKLESIDELINLHENWDKYSNIPFQKEKLTKIIPILQKINNLIGLNNIKNIIVEQIIYILSTDNPSIAMHTIIKGNQGAGKTTIANLISNLFVELELADGIVQTDGSMFELKIDIDSGRRIKDFLESHKKKVIIIDENLLSRGIYMIVNKMIDNQKTDCIFILTCNKKQMNKIEENVVGFKRKFNFRFEIDKYESNQIPEIFYSICSENKLQIDDKHKERINDFFISHKEAFVSVGGDLNNLIAFVILYHNKRNFLKTEKSSLISFEDIDEGFKNYSNSRLRKDGSAPIMMYSYKIDFFLFLYLIYIKMGLFSLFYKYFFGNLYDYPYCSSPGKPNKPVNLNWDKLYYDGQVCPGQYMVTIPGKH